MASYPARIVKFSDISCPNSQKNGLTEKVKGKAKKIVKTSNVREIILSLIGAIIAFIFAILMAHKYMIGEAPVWLIKYTLVGVTLIIIAAISETIKIAVKNVFFYIASVIFAITDYILQDRYINTCYGSSTIDLLRKSKGEWFLYNTFKVSHIIVVILGIAFAIALIYRMRQLKYSK